MAKKTETKPAKVAVTSKKTTSTAAKKKAVTPAGKVAKPVKTAKVKTAAKSKAEKPKATAKVKVVKATAATKDKVVKSKTAAPAKKKAAPAKKKAAPAKTTDVSRALAENVVRGILEKKGKHIVCIDLRKVENSIFDYFIICEGDSTTQVEAIGESVVDYVKKVTGERPYRSEGWSNALWILVDYVNVVVHVFEKDTRLFYNLEGLWADGEVVDLGIK